MLACCEKLDLRRNVFVDGKWGGTAMPLHASHLQREVFLHTCTASHSAACTLSSLKHIGAPTLPVLMW